MLQYAKSNPAWDGSTKLNYHHDESLGNTPLSYRRELNLGREREILRQLIDRPELLSDVDLSPEGRLASLRSRGERMGEELREMVLSNMMEKALYMQQKQAKPRASAAPQDGST